MYAPRFFAQGTRRQGIIARIYSARCLLVRRSGARWNDFHKAFVDSRRRCTRSSNICEKCAEASVNVQTSPGTCICHPLPASVHGTVVIFNSLFRSLYWRLFHWLQTRHPLSEGEGRGGDDAVGLERLGLIGDFIPIFPDSSCISAHLIAEKKPCFFFSRDWSFMLDIFWKLVWIGYLNI